MDKLVYVHEGDSELYTQEIAVNLKIPKLFVESCKIRKALYATINGFGIEERRIILLHYWARYSLGEIADLTKYSLIYIMCIIGLYLEKLKSKLSILGATAKNVVNIEDLFEIEQWKQYEAFLLEYEGNWARRFMQSN